MELAHMGKVKIKKEIIIIMIIGKGQSHKAVKVIVVLSMWGSFIHIDKRSTNKHHGNKTHEYLLYENTT